MKAKCRRIVLNGGLEIRVTLRIIYQSSAINDIVPSNQIRQFCKIRRDRSTRTCVSASSHITVGDIQRSCDSMVYNSGSVSDRRQEEDKSTSEKISRKNRCAIFIYAFHISCIIIFFFISDNAFQIISLREPLCTCICIYIYIAY